ncbi:hypothetical protein Tco_0933655, partial [Tanacetum coccineum]
SVYKDGDDVEAVEVKVFEDDEILVLEFGQTLPLGLGKADASERRITIRALEDIIPGASPIYNRVKISYLRILLKLYQLALYVIAYLKQFNIFLSSDTQHVAEGAYSDTQQSDPNTIYQELNQSVENAEHSERQSYGPTPNVGNITLDNMEICEGDEKVARATDDPTSNHPLVNTNPTQLTLTGVLQNLLTKHYVYTIEFVYQGNSSSSSNAVAGVGPLSGKGPRVIVSADVSILPQSVFVCGGATGAAFKEGSPTARGKGCGGKGRGKGRARAPQGNGYTPDEYEDGGWDAPGGFPCGSYCSG